MDRAARAEPAPRCPRNRRRRAGRVLRRMYSRQMIYEPKAEGDHMPMLRWFSIREFVLAGLVGLIVGWGAFLLTAQTSELSLIDCSPVESAGFYPLTGLPHGATIACDPLTGGQTGVAQDLAMPEDLASRRAVPVPFGFVVG